MENASNKLVIKSVAIVDDNDDSRATMSDELASVNLAPKPLAGPFSELTALVQAVKDAAEAAVCDHHLSTRAFAPCTGAECVASLYRQYFPAVLVTNWSVADFDQIRLFRRGVPVLMTPDEADADSLSKGFEVCLGEFRGDYLPVRKPRKTLVRVEEVSTMGGFPIVMAVVPAWDKGQVVRFPLSLIPSSMHQFAKQGNRFFARVNIGAEDQAELYFDEFQFSG